MKAPRTKHPIRLVPYSEMPLLSNDKVHLSNGMAIALSNDSRIEIHRTTDPDSLFVRIYGTRIAGHQSLLKFRITHEAASALKTLIAAQLQDIYDPR